MASGSSSQGSWTPAGAPAADNAHLSPKPSLNSEFVAMPATELVAHHKRHRRTSESDCAGAAPGFAAREPRPAEAEELVRGQRAENHALQQPRVAATGRSQQQPMAGDAKQRALQQPRAANANKARTMKKRPYKSLRMSAPVGYLGDESVGDTTSKEGEVPVGAPAPPISSKNEGKVGHDVPRHESLRMNASTRFGGRSARQAKQPRRRS